MTILVTCGIHDEWCTFAQGRLERMGFGAPVASTRSNMTANELTEKMLAVSRPFGKTSYKDATPALGQAWQIAAADLMIANADQDTWGWAHPDNLRFLDFWKTFDPNCRFVLVYTSPAEYIAREISLEDVEGEGLESLVERWQDYHSEMLRFYHANTDVSMLINLHNFEDTAQPIATLLSDRLELNATRLNESEHLFQSALMDVIAERLVDQDLDLSNIYAELENSADLPANMSARTRRGLTSSAYRELSENLGGLDEAQDKLLASQREIDQLSKDARAKDEIIEAQERAASEAHVPQLLEKQLEQVREELHLYFNKYHELKAQTDAAQSHNPAFGGGLTPPIAPPQRIDLKSYIDGEGWHHAEDHGRWAGAALSSTLRLPDLDQGKYRVSVRIVDTMALDILRDMTLSINGSQLNTQLKILSDMGGKLAPLRRAKAHASGVEKPLPATLSAVIEPTQLRVNDTNILSIDSPRAVHPPSSHGQDDRLLSCCIESVTFDRVA